MEFKREILTDTTETDGSLADLEESVEEEDENLPDNFEEVIEALLERMRDLREIEPKFRKKYACDGAIDIEWPQNRGLEEKLEEYEYAFYVLSKLGLAEKWKFPESNWLVHRGLRIPEIPNEGEPNEAEESIKKIIQSIKKDSDNAMKHATNGAEKLKATNETTERIKEELIKSMVKEEEKCREFSEMNKIINVLMQKNAETEETKRALEITKKELENEIIEAKIERVDIMMDQIKKWQESEGNELKLQFDLQTGEIKSFVCFDKINKKCSKCSCKPEDMQRAREKIQEAIKGLKNAINLMSGATKGTKIITNPAKRHGSGKRLYLIIRYAIGLPKIDKKVNEIWDRLTSNYEVISRSDLVSLAVIVGKYAEGVCDGILVEYETSMYSVDLDFMSIPEDVTEEKFSTDGESIEVVNDTIKSTSRAQGEATGARPRTTQTNPTISQSRGEIKKELDRNDDLIKELRERNLKKNAQKAVKADSKDKAKKIVQKMRGISREITTVQAARTKVRAANRQRSEDPEIERERPKLKIPPLDDGDSSTTYYSDSSDSDSDDSIPSVDWEY